MDAYDMMMDGAPVEPTSEAERAITDTERLDWLVRQVVESRSGVAIRRINESGRVCIWDVLDGDIPDGWCLAGAHLDQSTDLRTAIDAALRPAKEAP